MAVWHDFEDGTDEGWGWYQRGTWRPNRTCPPTNHVASLGMLFGWEGIGSGWYELNLASKETSCDPGVGFYNCSFYGLFWRQVAETGCGAEVVPNLGGFKGWYCYIYLDPLDTDHDGEGQFIFAGNTEAYPKYENAATKRMMVYKVSFDGDILWSKVIGSELSSSAAAVYGTLDGGCIASGYFYSLSSGAKDVILVKLDSFGMIEWQKSYGEKGNDVPMAVFPANDGGYVFAGNSYSFYPFNGDYWVVKLSAWGDVEWEKTYGRKLEDNAYCADITPDGGFIIAGESFSVDSENSDIWIVRLSASGNILWQKAYTQGERSRAE